MKRSLQFKIVVVLGYVALCTMLVVINQQAADGAAPVGQVQAVDFE
jgi:hypothetical protein